ncbi:MAG: DUF423 domain-containing protein, partial [Flavobacteriaceae bacterium]|nr:DUF423 domain-containing protein [Flavobacteriaceae bacterium]
FAIALVGLLPSLSKKISKWALVFFLFGVVLFSGSLYLLALKSQLAFSVTFLGPITPIGGFLLILGWIVLAYGLLTKGRG